jgi:hypothetical protein
MRIVLNGNCKDEHEYYTMVMPEDITSNVIAAVAERVGGFSNWCGTSTAICVII